MQAQYYRLEISPCKDVADPKGDGVLAQVRQFLRLPVERVRTRQVYSLFLRCSEEQAREILSGFVNPIIERGVVGESKPDYEFDWLVIVGFRPGVTDNVARSARLAVSDQLKRTIGQDEEIYTSTEFLVQAPDLDRAGVEKVARDLLANELIQTTVILSRGEWEGKGTPVNRPAVTEIAKPEVRVIDLDVPDEELMRISREGTLALTLMEMKAIQDYFRRCAADRTTVGLGPCPTDVELETLAQTWSEHCKHKIFNAQISYTDEHRQTRIINSCFKSFIQKSTEEIARKVDWLVSVFEDNAGVIRFNDSLNLVYKVETHNSPTALDPYGGAMTGIVGVNRDPMGTGKGADLLLNVWGYCFGSPFADDADIPPGLFHPRRLRDQVHKGVIDGGNQSGIPYVLGWEYFDKRYLGKPLVYCGTVGTLPAEIGGELAHLKTIEPGDLAVMVGGRIGKDGIHGATFSSEELHKDSPVQAVQIGDPITQRIMYGFLMEARDQGLYRFITDNGAGGLSSSMGEMARHSGGCELELAHAPVKYAGLQPWEILLSEAQERMSLAVPPDNIEALLDLAKRRNVEAVVLGAFTDSGKFHVKYDGKTVAYIDMQFMHDGLPQLSLTARWTPPHHQEPCLPRDLDPGDVLLRMLARLNVCSGEFKARQYDHEVKGLSVIKPYVGANSNVLSDATVSLVPPGDREGVIMAAGIAPRYSFIDTYHMMASVIDLAVRRTIAVGGRLGHIAGLDNFCWPDPVAGPKNRDGELKLAQLVRANEALYDITTAYGVPCISGKDSMKNDCTIGGKKISIPPTVLFSTIARMADVSKAITLDAKRSGDTVYVLGKTYAELGASELHAMYDAIGNDVPEVRPEEALALYEYVARATDMELCHSLHTPALGGLAVALAKIAIGGHLGLEVDLSSVPTEGSLRPLQILFSESNSRFVATVPPKRREQFEDLFDALPVAPVGRTTIEPVLALYWGDACLVEIPVDDLAAAYTKTLENM